MRHGRILIVEGDYNAREALAEILREEGHDVTTAGDAWRARAARDRFLPDLLLVDAELPEIDALCPRTRPAGRTRGPATIWMTTDAASRAADTLAKPIHVALLLAPLEKMLDEAATAEPARAAAR